jgi:hypothetical protein
MNDGACLKTPPTVNENGAHQPENVFAFKGDLGSWSIHSSMLKDSLEEHGEEGYHGYSLFVRYLLDSLMILV